MNPFSCQIAGAKVSAAVRWAVLIPLTATCQMGAASEPETQFFESRIRPLLVDRCVSCHSDDEPEGELSLESRQGWFERNVIVPGEPKQSLLITAVRFEDSSLQMPPPDSGVMRLSEDQIRDLERWISEGAVDPRNGEVASDSGPKRRPRQFQITDDDLNHWAFQPIRTLEKKAEGISASAMIDQLIDDKLRPLGIVRSSQATPRELVRRAYFDLWGLPPDPAVVAEFQSDPGESAWRILVDNLLESPHFGERWGRYWLDWVRFAETNGYERDGLKPNAWRYRDYVIQSFNLDKPFNRFLMEQLAGDLLIVEENLSPQQTPDRWKDAIVATGYYRLHVWDDEPDSTDAAELDDLDDVMVTTGAAMMGITIGCARCHDHKFDPFSQVDYYAMLDFFRDIDPYGLSKKGGGGRGTGRIERFLCSEEQLEEWREEHDRQIAELEAKLAATVEPELKSGVSTELNQLRGRQPPFEKALAINPPPEGPKTTFVLTRGDYQSPAQQVSASVPKLFEALINRSSGDSSTLFRSEPSGNSTPENVPSQSGPRLQFAKWLTRPENPLTARVLSNRVWSKLFGAGIVPTVDDFGYTGIAPKNRELLDHLAVELIQSGWSVKRLVRTIMNSQAYRMSSMASPIDNPAAGSQDADNSLFWRQNLLRLDAEAIRDSMLAYSGELNGKSAGPSVYTSLSAEIRDTANPVSLSDWATSPEEEQNCRSVFLIVKRSLRDPLLESFDFANSHSPVGQRPVTTVAPQALMLLNDRFVHQRSAKLAQHIIEYSAQEPVRIDRLWQIVYQRAPTAGQLEGASKFLNQLSEAGQSELSIWTSLVRVILNSNECIYRN